MERISSSKYLKNLYSLRNSCMFHFWDLSEFLKKDLSVFILKLDREIAEEKRRIEEYREREEKRQLSIYDLKNWSEKR